MLAAAIVFGFGALLSVSAGSRADTDEVSARELLQQARANREVFSKGFAGFTSRLAVRIDGGLSHGVFTFRMPDQLEIKMDEGELPEAVKRDIRSMLMHRVASDSDAAEEGVGYAAADADPLGRHIMMADSYRSAYRIRDRQILKVSRSFGGQQPCRSERHGNRNHRDRTLPAEACLRRAVDRETGELQEGGATGANSSASAANTCPYRAKSSARARGHERDADRMGRPRVARTGADRLGPPNGFETPSRNGKDENHGRTQAMQACAAVRAADLGAAGLCPLRAGWRRRRSTCRGVWRMPPVCRWWGRRYSCATCPRGWKRRSARTRWEPSPLRCDPASTGSARRWPTSRQPLRRLKSQARSWPLSP